MLMKHYESPEVPDWWEKQAEGYNSAMVELYRSRDAAPPSISTPAVLLRQTQRVRA